MVFYGEGRGQPDRDEKGRKTWREGVGQGQGRGKKGEKRNGA